MTDIVIVSARRTPIGKFGGSLKSLSSVALGTLVATDVLSRSQIALNSVDSVIFGNVLQAGSGQNIARQIALSSQLSKSSTAMTINQVCASGLKAIILGTQALQLGNSQVVLVGGTESMSNAPYLLKKDRWGIRYGHEQITDSILYDGLTDAFSGEHMGITAENIAKTYSISRLEQDNFAFLSHQKALKHRAILSQEIVPITIQQKNETISLTHDENVRENITLDRLATLQPAFINNGSVTAGNASSLNDGAAACLLTTRNYAVTHHLPILASIKGYAEIGYDPDYMGYSPVLAVKKLCDKLDISPQDFDCIESNEAFASQSLAVSNALNWDMNKINIHGGALALGHPIGASGARIVVSLLNALKQTNGKLGLATLCVGGGMGVALAIQAENSELF